MARKINVKKNLNKFYRSLQLDKETRESVSFFRKIRALEKENAELKEKLQTIRDIIKRLNKDDIKDLSHGDDKVIPDERNNE